VHFSYHDPIMMEVRASGLPALGSARVFKAMREAFCLRYNNIHAQAVGKTVAGVFRLRHRPRRGFVQRHPVPARMQNKPAGAGSQPALSAAGHTIRPRRHG
jgi:hypothetical protein